MSTPAFITTANGTVLSTGNLETLAQDGRFVLLKMNSGGIVKDSYATAALAAAGLANYAALLEVSGGDTVNPPIFDAVNHSPGATTPADVAKGCFWFGAGGEFYTWNPATAAWVGIITT